MYCRILRNNIIFFTGIILFFLININSGFAQVSLEMGGLVGKPFGDFATNINRDAFFGSSLGIYYTVPESGKLAYGLQIQNTLYDESSLNGLYEIDNIFVRQKSMTKVFFQSFLGVIRYQASQIQVCQPYFEGIIGLNRFLASTKTNDAYFTHDTNNNGRIDIHDGVVNPEDYGVTTNHIPPQADKIRNQHSLSPTFGMAAGLIIPIYRSLAFNVKVMYQQGMRTRYFDYGSQEIESNSADNFAEVTSNVPVFYAFLGAAYTINKRQKKIPNSSKNVE